MGTPAIATFPIGALLDKITVPTGKRLTAQLLTPSSVIFRSESQTINDLSDNSAGVIHILSPSQ